LSKGKPFLFVQCVAKIHLDKTNLQQYKGGCCKKTTGVAEMPQQIARTTKINKKHFQNTNHFFIFSAKNFIQKQSSVHKVLLGGVVRGGTLFLVNFPK